MKTITIGRGEGCDIKIDNNKISRRHALLKVYTFGKMEIVDMGQNGTWVNGIKLRPGIPFPVKRKDVVNFAEVSQLNWARIPNPAKYVKLISIVSALLLLVIVAICMVVLISPSNSYDTYDSYLPSNSSGVSSEENSSSTIESSAQQPSERSHEQAEDKEEKGEETGNSKNVMRVIKPGAKSAEELFPFINKTKKDPAKKDNGKKKEDKNAKDTKSEKPSKKVDVIL